MFRRRIRRTWLSKAGDIFYPPGGWKRAAMYVGYRLRRLPDPAYKISRGIAAGVFISFTPFYGFHFVFSALLAWALRGNIVAALLATFFGNPLTFPIIATVALEIGAWMLGTPHVPLHRVAGAFTMASLDLWANARALVTPAEQDWSRLADFYRQIFLPYLVGGIAPGTVAGVTAYIVSRPLITAYQKARIARLKRQMEKRLREAGGLGRNGAS